MAQIDVSDLLLDPDLADSVTLIRRSAATNGFGEGELTETATPETMVVQGAEGEVLERMPQGARLKDIITVFFRGELHAEADDGYADVIVWNGRRYQVKNVTDYSNFGAGFTSAECLLEDVSV